MMKKRYLLRRSILLSMAFILWSLQQLLAQSTCVMIKISKEKLRPLDINKAIQGETIELSADTRLNKILINNKVQKFAPMFSSVYRSDASPKLAYLKDLFMLVSNENTAQLLKDLRTLNSDVESIQVLPKVSKEYTPNDYSLLSGLDPGGLTWYLDKIRAEQAWDITRGNKNIKVALVGEDGYDVYHEDFYGKIAYKDRTIYPKAGLAHGTAVASLVASATDNGKGLVAIGFNTSMMFYTGSTSAGSLYDIINQAYHAALDGAHIVSISSAYARPNTAVYDAEQAILDIIHDMDVFVVASAGNGLTADDSSDPYTYRYPASYNHVFSVTSVWSDDAHKNPISSECHQYNDKVDLCSPGFKIWHATPYNEYAWGNGTSFSCPIVSGTAALLLDVNPCLTPDDLEAILKMSSVNIYGVADNYNYAGMLGAGRLDAYAAVQLAQTWVGQRNLIVTNGQNINLSGTKKFNSITVQTGGELRIDDAQINLNNDSRIVVEPGAKLYIFNSTLKMGAPPLHPRTECPQCKVDYRWDGIFVEGTPTVEQDYAHQGLLVMYNTVVQDALTAVQTMGLDANGSINWSKTGGGIISASSCTFKNNGRHIAFMSYHNMVNSVEQNNKSRFYKCLFEVDDNTVMKKNNLVMVTAWDVKGVFFAGCTFQNTLFTDAPASARGLGILSVDASLIIEDMKANPFAHPPRQQVKGEFYNLNAGIEAYFNLGNHALVVNNNNFRLTDIGVSYQGGMGGLLYRNFFDMTIFPKIYTPIGILMNQAKAFSIGENVFLGGLHTFGSSDNSSIGTLVINSKVQGDWAPSSDFFSNNVEDYEDGIATELNNEDLIIRCNTFNYNDYAININEKTLKNPYTGGVPFFGDCSTNPIDRNNFFSTKGVTFKNRLDLMSFKQEWNATTQSWPFTKIPYVVDVNLPFRPKTFSFNRFRIDDCALQGIPVIVQTCENSLPPVPDEEPIEEEAPLLGESGIIDPVEPIDPEGFMFIKEINDDIQTVKLLSRQVAAGNKQNIRQLSALKGKVISRLNAVSMLYNQPMDSTIEAIFSHDQSEFAKRVMVAVYCNRQQLEKAEVLLNQIKANDEENSVFIRLYHILLTLKKDHKNIFQMNELQKADMMSIAAESTEASMQAKGIMKLVYGTEFTPAQWMDRTNAQTEDGRGISSTFDLTAFPNPISSGQDVALRSSEKITEGTVIKVLDMLGRVVKEANWSGEDNNTWNLSTSGLATGLHLILIYQGNRVFAVEKLQIVQ